MNSKPIYRNGEQATIGPAGVLIFFGLEAFGKVDTGGSAAQKQSSKDAVEEVLHAAYLGGYVHGEILETLLARPNPDQRLGSMAQEACDAAGNPALREIFERAGLACP